MDREFPLADCNDLGACDDWPDCNCGYDYGFGRDPEPDDEEE